ncbi:retrovirus-related pol polyprotein from transposon TNT 1-94 [Tanacetum coccineum]|uniref:Retrovirus-related pol polyprotein from transposon TNT 1-94 n=1 Tax=Tanacetum coccineum TaxID=301880 RepID=A0ABQ5ELU8_9ASTR
MIFRRRFWNDEEKDDELPILFDQLAGSANSVKYMYVTRNTGKGPENEENTDSYETLQRIPYDSVTLRHMSQDYGVTWILDYAVTSFKPAIWKVHITNRPGIVKPKIDDDVEFEINSNFMKELRCKPFAGTNGEDAYEHVRRVLEIVDLFQFPGVTHDAVMLRVFPVTLKGRALRWKKRLPAGMINTWDLLKKGFIWQYCSPFKIAKKLEEICNFKQEMYETFPDNVDAIQESINEAHITKECPLKKEDKAVEKREKFKARMIIGKENMKELVPRELPPTPFLGHLKRQIGDMDVGWEITVEDVERLLKFLTPTIHTLPNHEPVIVHITPPDDDYVALATNPILNKHLNEVEEEFFDNIRVSNEINSNPVNDLKELLNTYDLETFIRELLPQVLAGI